MKKPSKSFFAFLLFGILLATNPASAQEAPEADDLISAITSELPPFWKVTSIKVTASVNEGDAVTPLVRQRFVAKAAAQTGLFLASEGPLSLDPFIVVFQTFPSGSKRDLYGTASSTFRAGKWNVKIDLENSLNGLGQPIALFDGPAIIAGSEEMKAAIDQMSSISRAENDLNEVIAKSEARRELALQALAAERSALEAEQRKQLGLLQTWYENAREKLIASEVTLTKIKKAEAETAALQRLEAARKAQAEQNGKTEAARLAIEKAAIDKRKAFYDDLFSKIEGSDVTLAKAVFDNAITSGDAEMIDIVARKALQSGRPVLQAKALAQILLQRPNLPIKVWVEKDTFTLDLIRIDEIDPATLRFDSGNVDGFSVNGTVSQTNLTIFWRSCQYSLKAGADGELAGVAKCGNDMYRATLDLL